MDKTEHERGGGQVQGREEEIRGKGDPSLGGRLYTQLLFAVLLAFCLLRRGINKGPLLWRRLCLCSAPSPLSTGLILITRSTKDQRHHSYCTSYLYDVSLSLDS